MEMLSDLSKSAQLGLSLALNDLVVYASENSAAHGFWEDYETIKRVLEVVDAQSSSGLAAKFTLDTKLSKIALMVSELGEGVEGIRKPHPDEHCSEFTSEEIELADAIIRIADYAGKFKLRLGEAVLAKMLYNESRPYMHGKGA